MINKYSRPDIALMEAERVLLTHQCPACCQALLMFCTFVSVAARQEDLGSATACLIV